METIRKFYVYFETREGRIEFSTETNGFVGVRLFDASVEMADRMTTQSIGLCEITYDGPTDRLVREIVFAADGEIVCDNQIDTFGRDSLECYEIPGAPAVHVVTPEGSRVYVIA